MFRTALLALFLALPCLGATAPLIVYDDALRNGFLDWSWENNDGDIDMAADFHVHAGTHAIFFKGYEWNAVSLYREQPLNTAQYKTLRFFIRGDMGGEQLSLFLENEGIGLYSGPLDQFITGGSVSNDLDYREVRVPLTQPPVNINGTFNRITLQSTAGTEANQQWVFIDEISLLDESGNPPVDVLFADGFEGDAGPAPQSSWLYAPQWGSNSIKVYHSNGGNYQLVNTASLPAGTSPNAVAFDNTGKLWVVGEHRRLLRYAREDVTTQAAPAYEVSVTPTGNGSYFQMAFWGNNAYISNSDFGGTNQVLRVPLATLNAGGTPVPAQTFTNGNFSVPAGLAFDTQGKLWISHYNGHRITRLNVGNSSVERTIESVNVGDEVSLSAPEGMAFNAVGDLFVGNNGLPSYVRYNTAVLNGAGNNPSSLTVVSQNGGPTPPGFLGGLAIDGNGNLWFNYQRELQIREFRANGPAGQTINNATTDPGFGGIALWPVPATLHRGH